EAVLRAGDWFLLACGLRRGGGEARGAVHAIPVEASQRGDAECDGLLHQFLGFAGAVEEVIAAGGAQLRELHICSDCACSAARFPRSPRHSVTAPGQFPTPAVTPQVVPRSGFNAFTCGFSRKNALDPRPAEGLGVIESARIRHGQNPTLNRTHIRFRTKTSPLPHHPRTPFSQDRIGDTTCINDKKIDQVVHHGPAVLNLPSRKVTCRTTNTPVPWTAHGGHLNLGGSPCPFDARPWPRRSP